MGLVRDGSEATVGLGIHDVVVRYAADRRARRWRRGGRDRAARRRFPRRDAVDGTTAVAEVSLDVRPGEILALLGPSGCGKSSLLRAVAGLEPLASGTVTWAGEDLRAVPVHRRGFGLMFQDGQLFPHRDVAGNVAYGLGGPSAENAARVAELLRVVGLDGYERRAVSTLSGGERQRVALARSLAPRPRLLLLDEPLSALDRALRERLAGDLRAALLATGTAAILVTHDHDEALTVADRVAVMDAGRVLQVAAATDLWRAPSSRRVAEFLGYQAFVPFDALTGSMRADARAVSGSAHEPSDLLAIGPHGLVAVGRVGEVFADARVSAGVDVWAGVVVGTGVRRGVAEVVVDIEDPATPGGVSGGTPGPGTSALRLVAVARTPDAVGWLPGTEVALAPDPAGCAVVPRP